jgi:hypothetical protein
MNNALKPHRRGRSFSADRPTGHHRKPDSNSRWIKVGGNVTIEQSPRFYMAVNLKTAALLGVSLSDVFIARANEVRE